MPTELHNVSIGFILLEFLKYYAELDVKKFAIACSTPGNPNSRLNTYPAMEVEIASGKDIEFKINLDKKFKINFDAPNFLNLLEITGANSANLIKNFDWNEFNDLSIAIPPLENGKDYLLQGTFYYCEQAKKSVCKIKSYEQKIIVNRKSPKNSIEFEIKN